MRLDSIDAAHPQDLAEVRDRVVSAWKAKTELEMLSAKAESLAKALTSETDFGSAGLAATVETDLGRRGRPADIPTGVTTKAFEMTAPATAAAVTSASAAYVVRLDAIHAADKTTQDYAKIIASVDNQTASSIDQDVFTSFAQAVQARTAINIDQAAVNAVHANFQ